MEVGQAREGKQVVIVREPLMFTEMYSTSTLVLGLTEVEFNGGGSFTVRISKLLKASHHVISRIAVVYRTVGCMLAYGALACTSTRRD